MKTVIEMAREAEFPAANYPALVSDGEWEALDRLIALARADEREACAKVCEEYETNNDITATWLNIVAEAIRARSNT
jgi:hypothetical protein